jgi:hypothetical protein
MNFKQFQKIVQAKFPQLKCEETVDRKNNPIYATTDYTITYDIQSKRWWYSEGKSMSGSGKTLDEAIENIPSLADEY